MRRRSYEKHGDSHSLTYATWETMKARCYNKADPNYPRYGGRGIKICDRWRNSYLAFKADMGERPAQDYTLDRFPDPNGDYEPGNCRWATAKQQSRNTCQCKYLTHAGETLCLTEWAERKRMAPKTLDDRLRRGWKVAQAIETPVGRAPANKK